MKTVEESIAFGAAIMRSPRYWYLDGGHETTITTARRAKYPAIPAAALGKLGIDCVWFVNMIAKDGGWAWMLSGGTPWGVGPVMDRARKYMATIPIGKQQRGDIAFFGTDHMAMFTEPDHVLQAFDERRGIIRTTLAGVRRPLTLVLRPPYVAPPVPVPPAPPADPIPPITPPAPPVTPDPPVAVPPTEPAPPVAPAPPEPTSPVEPAPVEPAPVDPPVAEPPIVAPPSPGPLPGPASNPQPVYSWASLWAALLSLISRIRSNH
jgi:hypothetical protein